MPSYIVDLTLYTRQHQQTEIIEDLCAAKRVADDFVMRTMVERATVIDTNTGEIKYDTCNPAAVWRAA